MKLPREFTNIINNILDNLVPPILRDSKIFMYPLMRCVLGRKCVHYMEFKLNLPNMSENDIEKYYEILADTVIARNTDINNKCLGTILTSIVGESVIDVDCGKGYLLTKT